MTTPSLTADPIAAHIAALERSLRGPRRVRRGMVAEADAGLRDTAAAYQDGGLCPAQAAERAVRDFGAVGEVAPLFQDELTARQGRITALVLAVTFPVMMFGWDLLWSTGLVTSKFTGETPEPVVVLARLQDVLTMIVGAVAVLMVLVTFRREASPRRMTLVIGVTGLAAPLTCGAMTIAMNVAGWDETHLLLLQPASWPAFGGSLLVMVLVVWHSARTLHVARRT